jgi:hypothetical protein
VKFGQVQLLCFKSQLQLHIAAGLLLLTQQHIGLYAANPSGSRCSAAAAAWYVCKNGCGY